MDTIYYVGFLAGNRQYQEYFQRLNTMLELRQLNIKALSLDGPIDHEILGLHACVPESFFLAHLLLRYKPTPDFLFYAEMNCLVGSKTLAQEARFLRSVYYSFLWIIRYERPALVILGHEFRGTFRMLKGLCDSEGVPTAYVHPGVLPGTICFEQEGQMGNSWVCKESEKFRILPVSESDIENAKDYIRLAAQNKWIRPGHTQVACEETKEQLSRISKRLRPVVLYVGSCDPLAGIQPRNSQDSCWHSPFLESSDHGFALLSEICEENDWTLIYKPHPMIAAKSKYVATDEFDLGCSVKHAYVLPHASIFDLIESSDVVATIVSQVSYETLLQGKPLVLMGHLQLSGQGAVYEAMSPSDVAPALKAALNGRLSSLKETLFIAHVARLLKYYLWIFDPRFESVVPRTEDDAVRYLSEISLKPKEIGKSLNFHRKIKQADVALTRLFLRIVGRFEDRLKASLRILRGIIKYKDTKAYQHGRR